MNYLKETSFQFHFREIQKQSPGGAAGLRPDILLKKRPWHRCFPVNFANFLRTPFLQNTSGGCFWRLDFYSIRFHMDSFWRKQILAYFRVVKFSWIVKFLQFCGNFICMVAKYVFLTFTVTVVKIERFAAMLPRLKSINQYNP